MPVVSKTQRAEAIQAKYNVTMDFPHLGLHSAAASGNIGLVKYALEHGQPVNSVLDGVLPLHAACSGGNDLVVRLLIERGADVNAPRLPRRYSSDKNRDTSAPIVGTSGSTPLHFACANGHTAVVLTLLMHGAHADRPDKHGTTPEILARQNGWIACADVLQQWSLDKDRDLREKEELTPSLYTDSTTTLSKEERHAPCSSSDCKLCALSRSRLRMKRSIDHAFHILKPSYSQSQLSSSYLDHTASTLEPIVASPFLPSDPVGDALMQSDFTTTKNTYDRRLPAHDVFDQYQTAPMTRRSQGPTSRSRRPRSAGTDAEQSAGAPRIRGKVSLLNIFKKNGDAISENPSGYTSTSSIPTSASPSPAPHHRTHPHNDSPVSATMPSFSTSITAPTAPGKFRGRLFSEGGSTAAVHRPYAVDLHRALSDERLRLRAESDHPAESRVPPSLAHRSPSARPSILRPHNRSVSTGQSQVEGFRAEPSGFQSRALRFDSSPGPPSIRAGIIRRRPSNSPARSVKITKSISSLRSAVVFDSPRSPVNELPDVETPSQGAQLTEGSENVHDMDDDEEHYGEPVASRMGVAELGTRLTALQVQGPSRRHSIISSHASLSPLPSPGVVVDSTTFDCPFSINDPPPEEVESPTHANLLGIHGVENRLRGDSISSMSTTGTSGYVATPGAHESQLPSPHITAATSTPPEFPSIDHGSRGGIRHTHSGSTLQVNDVDPMPAVKLPRAALDIDIRSISSHAQAEALVQRTQQSILDMQDLAMDIQSTGDTLGFGRTPLSAKLAAYGESLALERKLKQQQEERRNSSSTERSFSRGSPPGYRAGNIVPSHMRGLDRKFSLEERPRHNETIRQSRVRRPHTSGGAPSSEFVSSPQGGGWSSSINLRGLPPPASQVVVTSPSVEADDLHEDLGSSMTPQRTTHLKVRSEAYAAIRPSIRRSRTPDPESDAMSSSNLSFGVPLSRVSTAPAPQAAGSRRTRELSTQERQAARTNKLAKMGFASPDLLSSTTSNGHAQFNQSSGKRRFGGFKGFVQNLQLKGKP